MGGVDLQLEEILAEGERFLPCKKPEMIIKRQRARVTIISIHDLIPNIDKRVKTISSFFKKSSYKIRCFIFV